jgi:hypothetical protein
MSLQGRCQIFVHRPARLRQPISHFYSDNTYISLGYLTPSKGTTDQGHNGLRFEAIVIGDNDFLK